MLSAEEVGSQTKHQSMALSLLETLGVSLAEAQLHCSSEVNGEKGQLKTDQLRMGKHVEAIHTVSKWSGFSCQVRLLEGKQVFLPVNGCSYG